MAIRRMLDNVFARDEGESGGVDMVDIEVDGEVIATVPKSEVGHLGNLGNWRKSLTADADTNASVKRANASAAEELATDRAAFARERGTVLDERTDADVKKVEDAGIDTSDWPNPVDDFAGFQRKLSEGLAQASQTGYERAIKESGVASARRAKESEAVTAASQAAQRVFTQNTRTVDAYIEEMKAAGTPLTKEHTDQLVSYMDTSLRLPKEGLASRDPASGKILFTREAVQAAERSIRFDYHTNRAKDTGEQDALRRGGVADPAEALKAPGSKSTAKEKADFALTLSPKQQEVYIDKLLPGELDEVMLHIYKEAEQDGATSLMRVGDD